MSSSLIVAESIVALLHVVTTLARANNIKDEELKIKLQEALIKAKTRDPKDLPDV